LFPSLNNVILNKEPYEVKCVVVNIMVEIYRFASFVDIIS